MVEDNKIVWLIQAKPHGILPHEAFSVTQPDKDIWEFQFIPKCLFLLICLLICDKIGLGILILGFIYDSIYLEVQYDI